MTSLTKDTVVMPSHFHPEDDVILEYSAGSLDPAVALCVSVHLEHCELCREKLNKMDQVGAMLFEQQEPVAVSEGLLDSIFDAIDETPKYSAGSVKVKASKTSDLPKSVAKLIHYDDDSLVWKNHGSRVRSADLLQQGDLKAQLINIAKGSTIAEHGHKGREFTVILSGSFSDEDGVYREGDFICRKPGESHSPTATADKDCLCLIAVEAPLSFKNPLYEIYNRVRPM